MLGPVSVAFAILLFHGAYDFAQGLGGDHDKMWVDTSLEDVVRWEVKCGLGEEM
jgi:hypothetical protein